MKVNSKKRGFTIVELVIVVAVIGILAAILIPTFVNLTGKAQDQSDLSLIRNLNTQLAIKEIDEGKNKNMTEAVADAREMGFDVAKISPYGGKDIVWDSVSDRFAFSKNNTIVYPTDGTIKGTGAEIWGFFKEAPATENQLYSIYAKKGYTNTHSYQYKVGFDAGDNDSKLDLIDITNTSYTGDLVVYTKNVDQELKINAPLAKNVIHYGLGKKLDDAKMNSESYHEYGSFRQAFLDKGHAVVEAGGFIGSLHMTTKDGAAEVTLNSGSTIGSLYIDNTARTNKATVKSYGSAKIVYLSVAQSSSQLDIHLDTAPDYANVSDKNEGTAVIVGVGTVSDLDHDDECTEHHWVPEGAKVQVCTNCGEIKFSQEDINNPGQTIDYVEEDDGTGAMSEPEQVSVRNTTYEFNDSYVVDDHWVHEVSTPGQFRNILSHISSQTGEIEKGVNLADKDTEYKVINNINFGGKLWTDSYLIDNQLPIFTGKLVADTQMVLSNINNTTTTTQPISEDESDPDPKLISLFCGAKNATFKNITLDNIKLDNSSAKGSGFFAVGYITEDSHMRDAGYMYFENCIVTDSCSINGKSSLAGFVGQGRSYKTMTFKNCQMNATIQGSAHAVAGFVGAASIGNGYETTHSDGHDFINFENCSNNGSIIGTYRVGGFVAYAAGQREVHFKGTNVMNGFVYATNADPTYNGLFVGHSNSGTVSDYITFENNDAVLKNNKAQNLLVTGLSTLTNEFSAISSHLVDKDNNVVDSAKYLTFIGANPMKEVTLNFQENNTLTISEEIANVAEVKFTVTVTSVLSSFGGKDYPSKVYGSVVQCNINFDFDYDTIAELLSEIRRVKYAGYFIPTGAVLYDDTLSGSLSSSRLLDDSLKANNYQDGKYSNGVHISDNNTYVVVTNENNNGVSYYVLTSWRLRVTYSLVCYDANHVIVGTGGFYDGYVDDDHINDTTIGAIPNNI